MQLWEIIVLIVFIQMMLFLFINFVVFRESPKPHSKDHFTLSDDPEFLRMMYPDRYSHSSLYSSSHARNYRRSW